jgi:copper chaperone CopZ
VVELKVGMHCERCVKAIKKAIRTIDGNKPAINPVLSYTTKNRSL